MNFRRFQYQSLDSNRCFFAIPTSAVVLFSVSTFTFLALLSIKLSLENVLYRKHFLAPLSTTDLSSDISLKYSKLTDSSRFKIRSKGYPSLASIDFYPWDYIVEPFRESILEVPDSLIIDDFQYKWTIRIQEYPEVYEIEGASVVFRFFRPSKLYDIKLVVVKGDEIISTQVAHVMCKYVRREIRSLLEEDRVAYFKALNFVASDSNIDFASSSVHVDSSDKALQYMMVKQMSTGSCSPFHDGNGFFTNHAALTLELDQVMQIYNPSVSQPYWDFTIDEKLYGEDWFLKSPMFKYDWFGAASPTNDDHHITTAWISQIDIPISWDAPVHNSYGILTTKMNNNPSAKVSRVHSFCGLKNRMPLPDYNMMKGCLQQTTLAGVRNCLEFDLHENLHKALGGMWDCRLDLNEFARNWPETTEILVLLAMKSTIITDYLFDNGDLTCPEFCDVGAAFEDCRCSCPNLGVHIDNILWWEVYDMLDNNGILQKLKMYLNKEGELGPMNKVRYHFKRVSTDASKALWLVLLDLGCNPGKSGNIGTSLSAGDPIFWPIQSFFDRLWMYMRLNKDAQFDKFNWEWGRDQSDCFGHQKYDAMPFHSLFLEDSNDSHYYTNSELLDSFDPQNPALPYVYDNFE